MRVESGHAALVRDDRECLWHPFTQQLGWEAETHWRELAELMVDADRQLLEDQLTGKLVRIDR